MKSGKRILNEQNVKGWILVAALIILLLTRAPQAQRWISDLVDNWRGDQVGKEEVAIRTGHVSEQEYFSLLLQRWNPNSGFSLMFSNPLLRNVIVAGLAVGFISMFGLSGRDERLAVVLAVIGLLGCAAVALACAGDPSIEYSNAKESFSLWSTSGSDADKVAWADAFLDSIVRLKMRAYLFNSGLFAATLSLGYGLAYVARRAKSFSADDQT
jgi:hypothetical protein